MPVRCVLMQGVSFPTCSPRIRRAALRNRFPTDSKPAVSVTHLHRIMIHWITWILTRPDNEFGWCECGNGSSTDEVS